MIGLGKAIEVGLGIVDKLIPDKEAAAAAKLKLFELDQAGDLKELDVRMQVLTTEANSEHWLTANWRPVTMLTFVGLIVAHWMGYTAPNISEAQIQSLLEIVKLGLTGYVVGRSAEKFAEKWKQ